MITGMLHDIETCLTLLICLSTRVQSVCYTSVCVLSIMSTTARLGMYIPLAALNTSCICCCMQIDRLSVLVSVLAQEKLASQHIVIRLRQVSSDWPMKMTTVDCDRSHMSPFKL